MKKQPTTTSPSNLKAWIVNYDAATHKASVRQFLQVTVDGRGELSGQYKLKFDHVFGVQYIHGVLVDNHQVVSFEHKEIRYSLVFSEVLTREIQATLARFELSFLKKGYDGSWQHSAVSSLHGAVETEIEA